MKASSGGGGKVKERKPRWEWEGSGRKRVVWLEKGVGKGNERSLAYIGCAVRYGVHKSCVWCVGMGGITEL